MLRDLPVEAPPGQSRKALRIGGRTMPGSRKKVLSDGIKNLAPTQSLSAADAAFLYLERPEIPLAIAAVSVFDGVIPFDEFVSSLRRKLDLVPRFRQIVAAPRLNLGLPTWQKDRHFDIRQHIFQVSVDPPGGDAELEALAGRILSTVLDRQKPLWEIHVVDGLKGGRGALIFRLHHALADGVSAAQLQEILLDPNPDGSHALHKPRARRSPPGTADRTLGARISSVVQDVFGTLLPFETGALSIGQTLLRGQTRDSLKRLVGLLPELAASGERLPFNKPCGSDRKFCWAEFNLADVQHIREVVGGTVNDVILSVLTRALARYVRLHGQTVDNRFVRIVCPVNLRKGDSDIGLGNLISFLPVALPLDVRNPIRMVQVVAARTATMKQAGAAHLVSLLAACIAAAPAPLQALFWWALPQMIFPVPILNMICTNVPGPRMPLYAVGRQMIASYPQVPTGYELGINCAVQSYNGRLFFGLIADAHVASDVNRLRDFVRVSFDELNRAARKKAAAGAKKPLRGRSKAGVREHQAPMQVSVSVSADALAPAREVPTTPTLPEAKTNSAA